MKEHFHASSRNGGKSGARVKAMNRLELLEESLIQAICYERDLEQVQRIAEEAPELFASERSLGSHGSALACAAGSWTSPELLDYLLKRFSQLDLNYCHNGVSPLICAVIHHKKACALWLLEHGAVIDHPEGRIPPQWSAALEGDTELLEHLLRLGADPNRMHVNLDTFPLDVAKGETRQVLERLKAIGLYEQPDWALADVPGNAVMGKLMLRLRCRVSPLIVAEQPDIDLRLRMMTVNKDKHRLLFTHGLFALDAPFELSLVVAHRWNPYSQEPLSRFPIELMKRLCPHFYGTAAPYEGYFLDKEEELVKDLAWPEGILGLMFTRLHWAEDFPFTLYTLLPVRSRRSIKEPKTLEKNRGAGWQKLEIKGLTPAFQW